MSRVTRPPQPLATLLSRVLPVDGSPALAIDADWRDEPVADMRILHVRSSSRRTRSGAPFVHADLSALPARPAAFGACLIGSRPASPWTVVRSLRSLLQADAAIAWIVPIERGGWQRVRFTSRAAAPARVEDLCGALLAGGCRDIRMVEIEGRGNRVMVWGRFVAWGPQPTSSATPRS